MMGWRRRRTGVNFLENAKYERVRVFEKSKDQTSIYAYTCPNNIPHKKKIPPHAPTPPHWELSVTTRIFYTIARWAPSNGLFAIV
jgi:hypothetical protein